MVIQWRDEFSVGHKEIDEQHQKLFAIAGRAYDLLKNDLLTDKYDHIVEIFEELKEYTRYHFAYEEEYMQGIGFRKILSHKVMHQDFIDQIDKIDLKAMDENQDDYLLEILDFMVKWIEEHILKADKMYQR